MRKKDNRGGKREGAGRPSISAGKRRSVPLGVRVTVDEWALINEAAQKSGVTVSSYLRRIALSSAEAETGKRLLW
jgi:hypothetical protein